MKATASALLAWMVVILASMALSGCAVSIKVENHYTDSNVVKASVRITGDTISTE